MCVTVTMMIMHQQGFNDTHKEKQQHAKPYLQAECALKQTHLNAIRIDKMLRLTNFEEPIEFSLHLLNYS